MSRLLIHPIAVIGATVLVLLLCISLYFNTREIKQSTTVVESLEEEVLKKHTEVVDLHTQLEAAQQPIAKETLIRNQLLMQRPGEYIVPVPDSLQIKEENTVPILTDQETPPTIWQEWQQLLFE